VYQSAPDSASPYRLPIYARWPWGIYALDGDMLKTCDNAPDLDKPRPTAFEARAGSGCVLITFKRAEP
jgi:hypothetical protein